MSTAPTRVLDITLGNDWIPDLAPLLDADGTVLTGASVTLALCASADYGAPPVHGTLRRAAVETPAGSGSYRTRFLGRDLTPHLRDLGASVVHLVVTSGTRYRAVHRVRVRG